MKITFTENGKVVGEEELTPESCDPKNEFDYENWIFKTEVVR